MGHRQYFRIITDSEIKFLLKRNPHWDKVGKVKGKKTRVVLFRILIGWLPPGTDDSIKLRGAAKRMLIRIQLLSARKAYII